LLVFELQLKIANLCSSYDNGLHLILHSFIDPVDFVLDHGHLIVYIAGSLMQVCFLRVNFVKERTKLPSLVDEGFVVVLPDREVQGQEIVKEAEHFKEHYVLCFHYASQFRSEIVVYLLEQRVVYLEVAVSKKSEVYFLLIRVHSLDSLAVEIIVAHIVSEVSLRVKAFKYFGLSDLFGL